MLRYPSTRFAEALRSGELEPYDGPFGPEEASHLLRRATFGTNPTRLTRSIDAGLVDSLDLLLDAPVRRSEPLNVREMRDANVPVGESWVKAPALDDFDVRSYRYQSLQAWQLENYYEADFNVGGRMAFFWHNHFSVNRNGDPRAYYQYLAKLNAYATGNFQELIEEVAILPQMLTFLNGKDNAARDPNENFARELLELYTIGKGPLVAPGDYTTYLESDVRTVARALTGWRVAGVNSTEQGVVPTAYFTEARHETEELTLSDRMGGTVLTSRGADNYKQVIDAIFGRPYAAHHLCRKLYRYFVYYRVDDTVEREVIEPMALALRQANYEVAPVLRLLLGSRHFFHVRFRGTLIKSPLEAVIDATLGLGYSPPPDDPEQRYWFFRKLSQNCAAQEQDLFYPPTVAGWKAFYQAPQYNRTWVNAASLQRRTATVNQTTDWGFRHNGFSHKADLLHYISDIEDATDPNALIAAVAARLFSKPLSEGQRDALKDVLIPGLPDFEWGVEYGQYLDQPEDTNLERSVRNKVRDLVRAMLTSAEGHLA